MYKSSTSQITLLNIKFKIFFGSSAISKNSLCLIGLIKMVKKLMVFILMMVVTKVIRKKMRMRMVMKKEKKTTVEIVYQNNNMNLQQITHHNNVKKMKKIISTRKSMGIERWLMGIGELPRMHGLIWISFKYVSIGWWTSIRCK